jgi:hypothetical protein
MCVANSIWLTIQARLRQSSTGLAITLVALLGGSFAHAADKAKRAASTMRPAGQRAIATNGNFRPASSRSSGLKTKSFGPEATRQVVRATAEQLPAHPRGLPHHPVQTSPGDAVVPRHSYTILEAGPKEMPQPKVARRLPATGPSDRKSAATSAAKASAMRASTNSKLPPAADPRTSPADKLLRKRNIPPLTEQHDVKVLGLDMRPGGRATTPATQAETLEQYSENRRIRSGIRAALRSGVPDGLYYHPAPASADPNVVQVYDEHDLPRLTRQAAELNRIMEKFAQQEVERRKGRSVITPITPLKLTDAPKVAQPAPADPASPENPGAEPNPGNAPGSGTRLIPSLPTKNPDAPKGGLPNADDTGRGPIDPDLFFRIEDVVIDVGGPPNNGAAEGGPGFGPQAPGGGDEFPLAPSGGSGSGGGSSGGGDGVEGSKANSHWGWSKPDHDNRGREPNQKADAPGTPRETGAPPGAGDNGTGQDDAGDDNSGGGSGGGSDAGAEPENSGDGGGNDSNQGTIPENPYDAQSSESDSDDSGSGGKRESRDNYRPGDPIKNIDPPVTEESDLANDPSTGHGTGRGGNDLGPRGKLPKGTPGVTQQQKDLVGNAVGTTTGADDKERPSTGSRSSNASNSNGDLGDVGGRRMRRATGGARAEVRGPTEGIWWLLNRNRAQPPEER